MARFFRILAALGELALRALARRLCRHASDEAEAKWVVATLARLGGSFVKLGQMLSIRSDLLPDAWLVPLQRLQDRVPPFSGAVAEAKVAEALGPIGSRFESFEREPFAAASVAQVHRARTLGGADVIVKVRRPGIQRQVVTDMRVLRRLAGLAALLVPGLRRHRPLELVAELESNLLRELDFRREARNIRRFFHALSPSRRSMCRTSSMACTAKRCWSRR